MTLPALKTTALGVYSSIRCMSWVINTTVMPCWFSSRRKSMISV